MSSIALKFGSLVIRTLSKPIANFIKRQAREHEGFRNTCIGFAQSIHRVDMRWRIGLLQDAAALERQAAKDAASEAAKKKSSAVPTVKTEAKTKADEEAAAKILKDAPDPKPRSKPRIRPLSEAKAVEMGSNFISETFLFGVAASLILFEAWRSRRKENTRREDVADRLSDLEESENAARRALVELEREVLRLRARELKTSPSNIPRILPPEVYEERDELEEEDTPKGWFSRISSYISRDKPDDKVAQEALQTNSPGPAEKILIKSDKALEEARRKQAEEEAAAKAAATKTPLEVTSKPAAKPVPKPSASPSAAG